jgi:hypothetical protein
MQRNATQRTAVLTLALLSVFFFPNFYGTMFVCFIKRDERNGTELMREQLEWREESYQTGG